MDRYRRFSETICDPGYLHFDELAAQQIYTWESLGAKKYKQLFQSDLIDDLNGFHQGKRWMNITIAAWQEDRPRLLLFAEELREDFDDDFLKGIL